MYPALQADHSAQQQPTQQQQQQQQPPQLQQPHPQQQPRQPQPMHQNQSGGASMPLPMQNAPLLPSFNNAQSVPRRPLPKDGEINRFRRRKWMWMMAVIDSVLAVVVVGRFFHYVANDARISNSPPASELEDRISLLWTWFAFLAAYVCQLLMAVVLIVSTQKNDTETVLGNCQLYIYGAHVLNLYTFVELVIIIYCYIKGFFKGYMWMFVGLLAVGKIVCRIAMFLSVKLFMTDLMRPSCTCNRPPTTAVTEEMDGNLLPRQSWPSR